MSKSSRRSAIRLRGVRHNNLKNFDLDLPFNQLIVITGLSGSGKSSLAFDTLFAEGQRRYIETFSPYARQFFDRMDKPQVDSIEGIPPAIAIEQRNSVRTTRSTVGTMTEICDYMKVLWQHVARLHCRQCGRVVRKDSPQQIWEDGQTADGRDLKAGSSSEKNNSPTPNAVGPQERSEYLITFDLPLSEKLSYEESLQLVSKQGYQRLLTGDKIVRLDDLMANPPANAGRLASLTVIQDRISTEAQNRPRFVEACEQAYHFGKGKLAIRKLAAADTHPEKPRNYSNRLHCAECDLEYREPSPALFSFNNPLGACPACKGFGRIISIDYNLALPDRSKTLAGGVVKPWQTGQSAECQTDLMRMCRHSEIPVNVPFDKLPKHLQELVIEGDPEYGKDEEHQWPRAWYGIKGYFRWLESKTYKMHVRVLLSRYRCYTTCPVCHGKRLQPEALLYRITTQSTQNPDESGNSHSYVGMTLSDFYQLPIREALQFIKIVAAPFKTSRKNDPIQVALSEVQARLGYLDEVGLGYLTLDRPTRSLSGGETERVNLTACLGTRLVNTLYVLDEPSVGLHPRDTERLVGVLCHLRDTGNTVVVVEHEPSVMREADQIIDLGPGHGATGGEVVFQGSYSEILKSPRSLTGQYLSRKKEIEVPPRRPVSQSSRAGIGDFLLRDARHPIGAAMEPSGPIRLSNVSRHNLKDLSVEIPLNRFVCVTGVSGSGKTTLIREVLLPLLDSRLRMPQTRLDVSTGDNSADEEEETLGPTEGAASIEGMEGIERVLMVDQSSLGKTPRSNPAVYIGAFDDIRDLFGQSEAARKRGLASGAFSFNSRLGQCERCRGAGFEKIEMQFLSDIFIRCPVCDGRRYQQSILDVKISSGATNRAEKKLAPINKKLSIADLLDLSIEEAVDFLTTFAESKPARRAANKLQLLLDVGLGYLKVGQPINTLSGGESQRLKLVRHLAEAFADASTKSEPGQEQGKPSRMTQNYQFERRKVSLERPRAPQTLFLFDEPTTGLHFDDVRVLLKVFQRLVDAGHSIMVVEHNLEVIKSADWVIDLGPEAGDLGGQIVVCGTPEDLADCEESHTGRALKSVLSSSNPRTANRTANALA